MTEPLRIAVVGAGIGGLTAAVALRHAGFDVEEALGSVAFSGPFSNLLFAGVEPLLSANGRWGERQLLDPAWIAHERTPSLANPEYGALWWLNTGRTAIPAAPESAYWAAGFGGHYVYIDPANDLVVVLRWVPDLAGTITRVLQAQKTP